MDNGYLAVRIIENSLLPPGGPILLALLALLLVIIFRKTVTFTLLTVSILLIYLAAIPATTTWLDSIIDTPHPFDIEEQKAEAIVVLGASRYRNAPEYGGDTIFGFGLERIRYAAWLQKRTELPLLTTGGTPTGEAISEALLMKKVLTEEFSVPVKWVETKSKTTWENALYSSDILKQNGIKTIALVTHAWHMTRAKEAFEKNGLIVLPAATLFHSKNPLNRGILEWIPNASAQYKNWYLFHEIIGQWWYRYKY